MRERLALGPLRRTMERDEQTAGEEFGWRRVISRLEDVDYRDHLCGRAIHRKLSRLAAALRGY